MAERDLQFLSDNQASSYTFVALTFLYVYDSILSFEEEYEYIWKGRLSWVKVLYLAGRYGTAVQFLMGTILFFQCGLSTEFCHYFFLLYVWLSPLQTYSITVIMALRTHALYSSNRRAGTFVNIICATSCFVYILSWLVDSHSNYFIHLQDVHAVTCYQRLHSDGWGNGIIGFANLAVYDLTVFVMTSVRCTQLLRMRRTKLVWHIFCDSIGYYIIIGALTILNIVAIGTIFQTRPGLVNLVETPLRILETLLVLRISLKLRKVATELGDPSLLVQELSLHDLGSNTTVLRLC